MVCLDSLSRRRCQRELMDEPDLGPGRHVQALRALARINWISASDRILWKPLAALAKANPGRTLRVLDIATGGGDVPIRLWRRAYGSGLNLEIHGTDVSATALELARHQAEGLGAEVRFFRSDVLEDGVPSGFDVLTSSLFLHHLSEEHALFLLRQMRDAAGHMVLINDLRRCRMGFLLAWLGTRVLTTSAVVHVDGPRSVEAAFTLEEVRALADQAGLENATLARHWPYRFLLAWRRA